MVPPRGPRGGGNPKGRNQDHGRGGRGGRVGRARGARGGRGNFFNSGGRQNQSNEVELGRYLPESTITTPNTGPPRQYPNQLEKAGRSQRFATPSLPSRDLAKSVEEGSNHGRRFLDPPKPSRQPSKGRDPTNRNLRFPDIPQPSKEPPKKTEDFSQKVRSSSPAQPSRGPAKQDGKSKRNLLHLRPPKTPSDKVEKGKSERRTLPKALLAHAKICGERFAATLAANSKKEVNRDAQENSSALGIAQSRHAKRLREKLMATLNGKSSKDGKGPALGTRSALEKIQGLRDNLIAVTGGKSTSGLMNATQRLPRSEPRNKLTGLRKDTQRSTPSVPTGPRIQNIISFNTSRTPKPKRPVEKPTEKPAEKPLEKWRRDALVLDRADYRKKMGDFYQMLKAVRVQERKDAIKDRKISDPDKPTTLAEAIKIVGTCQDMCPEFERIERISQMMVEGPETVPGLLGKKIADEQRMVKRFRRSAAGYDEQLPSDIRPPRVLQKTLNYLFDEVVGKSEPLKAEVHRYVWDRTRGIRNDFSIQQVTKLDDVKIAMDCYERIARFHVLCLHQFSNPTGEATRGFDHHQELEQLANTLVSLTYFYDDNRKRLTSPNEAEFRAYCIIFDIENLRPDVEERAQAWGMSLFGSPTIQTALKLYAAAVNNSDDQGPWIKSKIPFNIAQMNPAVFWNVVKSDEVPYTMACFAEIYFHFIRAAALEAIWRAYQVKRGPSSRPMQEWPLNDMAPALGFDEPSQARKFAENHGFKVGVRKNGELFVDLGTVPYTQRWMRDDNPGRKQVHSKTIVEPKRMGRSLHLLINSSSVLEAKALSSNVADLPGSPEGLFIAGSSDEERQKAPAKPKTPEESGIYTQSAALETETFASPSPDPNPYVRRDPEKPKEKLPHDMFAEEPVRFLPFDAIAQDEAVRSDSQTYGAFNPSSARFGSATSSASPSPSSSLFGMVASALNTSAATIAFGQPSSMSNPPPPTKPKAGPFFNTSGTIAFGKPSVTAYSAPTTSTFMNAPPAPNPFGIPSDKANPQPLTNPFGDPVSAANPSPPGNPFGKPSVKVNSPPQTDPFEDPLPVTSASPLANPFGKPSVEANSLPTTSPFSPAPNPLGAFGKPSKIGNPQPSANRSGAALEDLSQICPVYNAPGQFHKFLPTVSFGQASEHAQKNPPPASSLAQSNGQTNMDISGSSSFGKSPPKSGLRASNSTKSAENESSTSPPSIAPGTSPAPAGESFFKLAKPGGQNVAYESTQLSPELIEEAERSTQLIFGVRSVGQPSKQSKTTPSPLPSLSASQGFSPESNSTILTAPAAHMGSASNLQSLLIGLPNSPEALPTTASNPKFPNPPQEAGPKTTPLQGSKVKLAHSERYPRNVDPRLPSLPIKTPSFKFIPAPSNNSRQSPSLALSKITPAKPAANTSTAVPDKHQPNPIIDHVVPPPSILQPPVTFTTPAPLTPIIDPAVAPPPSTLQPSVNFTPAAPLAQQEKETVRSDSRSRVLDSISTSLVLDDGGIMDQFLEFTLADVINDAARQVEDERSWTKAGEIRSINLAKKYGLKWHRIWWGRAIRKASTPLKDCALFLMGPPKDYNSTLFNLENLIPSQARTKRKTDPNPLTESASSKTRMKRRIDPDPPIESSSSKTQKRDSGDRPNGSTMPPPLTTLKRKSLPRNLGTPLKRQKHTEHGQNGTPRRNESHHKRSKTVGNPRSAVFTRGGNLYVRGDRSRLSDRDLRAIANLGPRVKADSTQTDYFMLKSYGIDPDTPIFPRCSERRSIEELESSGVKRRKTDATESATPSSINQNPKMPTPDLAPRYSMNQSPTIPTSDPAPRSSMNQNPRMSTSDPAPRSSIDPASFDSDPPAAPPLDMDSHEGLMAQARYVRELMAHNMKFYREVTAAMSLTNSTSSSPNLAPRHHLKPSETEKERRKREFKFTPSRTEQRLKQTSYYDFGDKQPMADLKVGGLPTEDTAVKGSSAEDAIEL